MFVFLGEHIFYYQSQDLLDDALKVGNPNIYLIQKNDNIVLPDDVVFLGFRENLANICQDDFYQLSRASQIRYWQQTHFFCSRCGTRTTLELFESKDELATTCPRCLYRQYPRIQPCTITAVTRKINQRTQILLAYHNRAKPKQVYSLIAGFVEVGETLENCVKREVNEEVGLVVDNVRYVASQPWAFASNLMVGFVADYVSGEIAIDTDELADAKFFDLDNLPKTPDKGTIAYDLIEFVKAQAIG